MELTLERVVEVLTAPTEPCPSCGGTLCPRTDNDLLMGACQACGLTGRRYGREEVLIEQQGRRWLRELARAVKAGAQ